MHNNPHETMMIVNKQQNPFVFKCYLDLKAYAKKCLYFGDNDDPDTRVFSF